MRGSILASCVLAVAAAPAFAGGSLADIRIDLSDLVSTTPGNWNNVGNLNAFTGGLIDFNSGAATSVGISGVGWSDFFGDDDGAFPEQDWVVQPAPQDGAGLYDNQTGTFTISGLDASIYRIEIVSARSFFGYLNTITVNGDLADRTFLGTPVQTPWNSATDGLEDGNWLIWDDVVPDDGEINIMNVSGPDTLGMINAMRIVEIPAPGAVALFGLAGVAASRRRR